MKKIKQWAWVKGTDKKLKIFRNGDIYIMSKKRMAMQFTDPDLYLRVYCMGKKCRVHVLVADHFDLKLPKGCKREDVEVKHKDLDRGNPHIDNLEFMTHSQNLLHRGMGKKRGVSMRGKKFVASITVKQVSTHLGTFVKEDDAYNAYFLAYKKQYGKNPW